MSASSVIAIDGPAGSGKSTLAFAMARKLDLPYVNTGLMYRALTEAAIRLLVDPDDGPGLARLASGISFELSGAGPRSLRIDGKVPGSDLTSPEVEALVSRVSRHREVRGLMVAEQRRLGSSGGVVEGRDIGTVVFPDADLKIFLEAEPGVRKERRAEERGAAPNSGGGLAARDAKDSNVTPFVPAPDALRIDTTGKGPDEVLAESLAALEEHAGPR